MIISGGELYNSFGYSYEYLSKRMKKGKTIKIGYSEYFIDHVTYKESGLFSDMKYTLSRRLFSTFSKKIKRKKKHNKR